MDQVEDGLSWTVSPLAATAAPVKRSSFAGLNHATDICICISNLRPARATPYIIAPGRPTHRSWRSYVRDPRAPSPRPLDTGLLLCEGHGMLLAPPHVEEFLAGERRSLMGGLDPDHSGVVSEILTPEEWDALTLVRQRMLR